MAYRRRSVVAGLAGGWFLPRRSARSANSRYDLRCLNIGRHGHVSLSKSCFGGVRGWCSSPADCWVRCDQAEMCSDSFQLLGMAERGFLPAALAKRCPPRHPDPGHHPVVPRHPHACHIRLLAGLQAPGAGRSSLNCRHTKSVVATLVDLPHDKRCCRCRLLNC